MWCKNCLMQALDKKVHSARQHAVVFAISSLRILLFVGQGQLLQPFFRDTQRLFLYLLLVFLAQKVWPKKLGYFWYIKYKKKTRQITGYRLGWCPWKTLTGSRPRRFKVFFRWWNPLEDFIFCTKMNSKPLKIVSTEFTLSFKRNLKAIRPLLGPLLNLFFMLDQLISAFPQLKLD